MVQIGSVTIKGPAVLAPMAGTADRAFREICASFGAAYVISEMVSAKALTYGDKKSRELMELSSQERPAEKMYGMLRHIRLLCDYKGEEHGMREARKHAGWYLKGLKGAAGFRREAGSLKA